jgi:hypothetical protein
MLINSVIKPGSRRVIIVILPLPGKMVSYHIWLNFN